MAAKKQNNRYGNRSRNNNGNRNNNNQNNHRARNTYKQNLDKYTTLAKDAASNGDHITAEGHRQHAEHYLRQLNELGPVAEPKQKAPASEPKKEELAPVSQDVPASGGDKKSDAEKTEKSEPKKKAVKKEESAPLTETVEIDLGETSAS